MAEISMIISGIINQEDKRFVRVAFSRERDMAEFTIPDTKLEKNEGFSEEEIAKLIVYLDGNKGDIMEQARLVNPIRNWMK